MQAEVHPSAVVDPGARLAEGVVVGPGAVVGAEVEVGEGTRIDAGAVIEGPTRLGRGNRVFPHACLGTEPQDLKYAGERVALEIGDDNQFREFVTVHRGTGKGGGVTRIGSGNLFMVYSHVAHDCQVGDQTIFSNCATLAGHVEVEDEAVIGAFSAVHQFCRVGRSAYIGGYSVITMDALPFAKTVGMKPVCFGVNRIGMERSGHDAEAIRAVERGLRLLTRSKLNVVQALERIETEYGGIPLVDHLVAFVRSASRGVIRRARGGSRGG